MLNRNDSYNNSALKLNEACTLGDLDEISRICDTLPSLYKQEIMTNAMIKTMSLDIQNKVEIAIFLLSHGASKNGDNKQGDTILHMAANGNATRLVKWILDNELIYVDAENKSGWTPFQSLIRNHGNMEIAKLLIDYGANINKSFYSRDHNNVNISPLCYAIKNRNLPLTQLLLTNKVEVNATPENNNFPIAYAVENGDVLFVKLLFQHGAGISDSNCNLMKKAINSGNRDLIETLLIESLNKKRNIYYDYFMQVADSHFKDLIYYVLKNHIRDQVNKLSDCLGFRKENFEEKQFNQLFYKLGLSKHDIATQTVVEKSLAFIEFCDYLVKRKQGPEYKTSTTIFGHQFNIGCSKAETVNAGVVFFNSLINAATGTNSRMVSNSELSSYIRKIC